MKTWFAPLFNESEKPNGFFTCGYNVSTNHSAPTKSNRVFGSFVFSLKVLFWQLFQKVKTFRFLVRIISQENCQKKLMAEGEILRLPYLQKSVNQFIEEQKNKQTLSKTRRNVGLLSEFLKSKQEIKGEK